MQRRASVSAERRGASASFAEGSTSGKPLAWIRHHKLIACVCILAIAATAIAQQAFEGETEWFESDGQGAPESTQMFAAAMVNVPDQAPIDLTDGLPAHNATVGSVAGEAGVSGGAATYSIPIVVPPGRRGMQPELALSYSSRAGNGIAGMGWSLSGLSSIHRCPQTIEQDGAIRPVQLDGSDRLCLDGQRLVATSGTYGSVNTQYKTELDSFERITQLGGTLASETSYFKVELKSGEIVWYGGTSTGTNAARVIPGGGVSFPLSWLIERRQDRVSNLVRYAYTDQSNGEVLLSSIVYTGFGTTDGNRKVAFTYETRPTAGGANDQSSSYLAGGLTRQTRRLKTILTTVGTEKVREYELTYQTSAHSGRSLLNSIVDCAYDGATRYCKPATSFAWQQSVPAWHFAPLPVAASAGLPDLVDRVISIRPLGDVNGDGAGDSMLIASVAGNPSAREIHVGSLTADRRLSWAIPLPASSYQLSAAHTVDFDLDGRMDFVSRDASNNLVVWFWHGPVNATSFSAAFNDSFNTGITAPLTGGGVEHVGDMDGDGRADLVISRDEGTGASSCGRRVKIYRNVSSGGSGMPTQFSEAANHCLARTIQSGYPFLETVQGIRDADGDGLPDIWVKSYLNGGIQSPDLDRIVYGRRSPGYALAPQSYGSLFPASDPMQGLEDDSDLFSLWTDVNGDGLDDLVYARSDGKWTLRLHIGKGLGNRILLPNNNGIERCLPADLCGSGSGGNWRPWYGARIRAADYDADGRFELLIPGHIAARHCQQLVDYSDPNEPEAYFACTEDYETGIVGFTQAQFDDGDAGRVRGSYRNGLPDLSAYRMAALRFVETAPNQFAMIEVPTDIVLGADGGGYGSDDLFGDGLSDLLTRPGCVSCVIPIAYANGTPIPEESSPRQLPGGYSVHTSAMFLNENAGPGGTPNLDGLTPKTPDMMSMATDGLGNQTVWTYYPLSSKAGRTAGETPLYTVPTDAAARYVDDRHFYFTSSMQVVSEMIQSDGLGDHRAWRYGYSEAMYNARGRGFQGFRKIIEEDEAAGTRTTTTFHQKFPLTSQPEQIVVNSLNRSGVTAPISLQKFTWRCNLADRADIAACAPSTTASVRFPYLDTQETSTYDAATADNPSGGTPPLVSYQRRTNADVCNGAQPAASGYDQYGNLKVSLLFVQDSAGSGGYRRFVASRCTRTDSIFATADTTNWWVDKLESRTVSTSISYDAANHPLPVGTVNPTQTVITSYTWNTNRTPATETLQPGIANQQRVTAYGYPASNNYGLPTSVTVTASGDPNGARTVQTTYSPDGYFPQVVKNPLLHPVTMITRTRDGQPTMITDANGLRTLIAYDAFGFAFLTKFRGMTDGEMVAPDRHVRASWCAVDGCVANGKYFVRTIQDGTPTNTTVFDQLRRPLRSRTRLLDETDSIVDTQYDARGLVSRQSAPFRDLAERLWTEYTGYDVLGRLTGKIEPQPNQDGRGHRVTTYTYSGRQTAIKVCGSLDPASRCLNLSRTTDSLGRYMETVDAKAGITRFWYDSAGNALAIRDANQNTIKAAYNALGQRTSVSDPNQGNWSFGYNALGEVLEQTDARNITTTTKYDKLGRPWQVSATVDIDGIAPLDTVLDTFTYDPAYGRGLEGTQSRTINGALQREIVTTYDLLSRPASVAYDNATATPDVFLSLTQETAFDVYYGRPKAQGYGNGETLWLRYSKYGQPIRESDAATGADYRVVTAVDVRGNAIAETLAGGELGVAHSYHPQTGQVASIRYANLSNPNLRVLTYAYDVFGNLGQQTLGGATQEEFTYDALHRLTEATRTGTGTGTVQYTYDAVGNFVSKSDFSLNQAGAYSYSGTCGGGPNAVKSVQLQAGGTRTYCYDANGNLTSDSAGLVMKYDHTQRPVQIVRGGITRHFRYDASGTRFWQFGSGESTQYFPGVEKRYGAINDEKTYLGSRTVVTTQGGVRRVETLLTDRLGSVEAVANADGAMIESRGYDAFGKPRLGTWANAPNDRLGSTANTPHGFTGHEHLNSVGLIHMNGRVYDYALGRFTGVDPVIQFPLNSQSLNPYSYILNNPLSGTDPTGYMYEWRGECKGRQGCEMQRNKLNDLQAEIQGIAGVMGAGANSSRVTAGREARNGARTGDVQVGKLEKVADIDAANTRSNGPELGGGSGCYSDCAATTYPYRDIDRGADTIVGLHPYDIAMEQASRETAFANEGIEPFTFVEENLIGGGLIKGGLIVGGIVKRSAGRATQAGVTTLRGASAGSTPGRTVLGHYPEYVDKAAELGARRFNIPTSVWNRMSTAEQWVANQKFLDRMIARGDEIILATPVREARAGSFFARELEYLASKGYTPSADGLRMLPVP